MNQPELKTRRCQPCTGETPPLPAEEVQRLLAQVPGWQLSEDGKTLEWQHRFANFVAAVNFVNRLATVAEEEDHHPDLRIYNYRWLALDFTTHAIGGLSENDFIMAAKVNDLLRAA